MEKSSRRKFVGSIDDIKPRNVFARERAHDQHTDTGGLSSDYLNFLPRSGAASLLGHYFSDVPEENKKRILRHSIDAILNVPSYTEYAQGFPETPFKKSLTAEDVRPYVEAVDEIVADMKILARGIEKNVAGEGISEKLNRPIKALIEYGDLIARIVSPKTSADARVHALKNNLSTDPVTLRTHDENLSDKREAIERIRARINAVKEILSSGTHLADTTSGFEGGFSYLRNDGNVTPVDWEPTPKEKKEIRKSVIKNKKES